MKRILHRRTQKVGGRGRREARLHVKVYACAWAYTLTSACYMTVGASSGGRKARGIPAPRVKEPCRFAEVGQAPCWEHNSPHPGSKYPVCLCTFQRASRESSSQPAPGSPCPSTSLLLHGGCKLNGTAIKAKPK